MEMEHLATFQLCSYTLAISIRFRIIYRIWSLCFVSTALSMSIGSAIKQSLSSRVLINDSAHFNRDDHGPHPPPFPNALTIFVRIVRLIGPRADSMMYRILQGHQVDVFLSLLSISHIAHRLPLPNNHLRQQSRHPVVYHRVSSLSSSLDFVLVVVDLLCPTYGHRQSPRCVMYHLFVSWNK